MSVLFEVLLISFVSDDLLKIYDKPTSFGVTSWLYLSVNPFSYWRNVCVCLQPVLKGSSTWWLDGENDIIDAS